VQQHALQLLRSGDVSTFPALIRRVLEDVRNETQAKGEESATKNGSEVNGNGTTNGKSKVNGANAANTHPLAIPNAVIDDVLRVTRESLEAVCGIDESA
jgi:hypothetical protein